jgi:hypothetical protein
VAVRVAVAGVAVEELLDADLIHGVLLDEPNQVPSVYGLVLD